MQLSNVWFTGHNVPSFELNHRPVVLLVEQDLVSSAAISEQLQSHFEVVACESGSEALHALELEPPDAIVIDFDLPDMEGATLADTVRRDWMPQIPIVLISGNRNHPVISSDDHFPASDMPCMEESLVELLTSLTP